MFNRKDYAYQLPDELIARYPLKERSASRLLVLDKATGQCEHHQFGDIGRFLRPGDLLVMNNTRVIPARLNGRKDSGGKVEVLVERLLGDHEALAHVRASKSPRAGGALWLEEQVRAEVLGRCTASGEASPRGELFHLRFDPARPVLEWLHAVGHMPLPPYIDRADEALDQSRYQTVYADESRAGAVAAPTAGLHFDEPLLERLKRQGVEQAFVTLHVGAGTFQPVRVEDIREHTMHQEYLEVPEDTAAAVNACRRRGGRVVAVGTTSVRSLETAAACARQQGETPGTLVPFAGDTRIFIYPGYEFQAVDALVTNFHLPESTLLMLVSALAGKDTIMRAYQEAIDRQYRFFSYGDAMLIL